MQKNTFILVSILISLTGLAQNQLLSETEQFFDFTTNTFVNSTGNDFSYNANGNLIETISYDWNSSISQWEPRNRETASFNSNNRIIEILDEEFNDNINQYEVLGRTQITYNSSNNPIQILDQEFNGSQFVNDVRFTFSYTGGLVTGDLFEEWDGNQYQPEERAIYNYDSNQNLTFIDFEEWNGTAYELYGRDSFIYNSNNQLITYTYRSWDGSGFNDGERSEYAYDGNGNRIQETNYFSDFSTPNSRRTTSFDLSVLDSAIDHHLKDDTGFNYLVDGGYPYVNKFTGMEDRLFDSSTSTYEQSNRTLYNFNSGLLSNTEITIPENEITLSPNPTTEKIEIKTSMASINKVVFYDVTGKKVFSSNNNTINISNLESGVYLLRITDEDGLSVTRKLIKE